MVETKKKIEKIDFKKEYRKLLRSSYYQSAKNIKIRDAIKMIKLYLQSIEEKINS